MTYLLALRNLDKVIGLRIASVLLLDVLETRLGPVDVDGSHVDAP